MNPSACLNGNYDEPEINSAGKLRVTLSVPNAVQMCSVSVLSQRIAKSVKYRKFFSETRQHW